MSNTDAIIEDIMTEHAEEVSQEATPEPEAVEPETPEADEPAVNEDESPEDPDAVAEVVDEPFPKKAQNALSRRDKKINRQNAQLADMQKQLDALNANQSQTQEAPKAPVEDDYDTYGEFLQANTQYEIKKALGEAKADQPEQEQPLTPEQAKHQEWEEQRTVAAGEQADKLIDAIPDYEQTIQENMDLMDTCPPEIEQIALGLDNAPLAIYNIAKAGRLEAVMSMPPQLAAIELMNAQNQGYTAPKKVTSAPKPISASKGSGTAKKSLEDMDGDEIVKHLDL